MELRLQEFIQSVSTLADIRNLDQWNPIVFQLEHPINATRFTIVGAKQEPSYLGIPVNTTWVVLDPESEYYNRALKLVDVNEIDQATTIPPVTSEDGELVLYWNIIRTYDEIFEDPQYYNNGGRGPKGDKGDKGDPGVIDYSVLISRLAELTGLLEIVGPTSLREGSVQQYLVQLSEPQILTDGTVTPPVTTFVNVPVYIVGAVPDGTTIDTANVLHAGQVSADTVIRLYAEAPSWGRNVFANLAVTITDTVAEVTGVTVVGATNVNSGSTSQYAIAVAWSDGTNTYADGVWSLSDAAFGTISATGLLDVPANIADSGTVQVNAEVTIAGVTYNPSMSVVVTKQVVIPTLVNVVVDGPNGVDSNTTAQFSVTAYWSDGSTTNPSVNWSLSSAAFGSISNSGLLTVPDSISSSGTVVVTASFVIDGVTYSPTKSVAVTKIVAPPTVTGVTITGANSVFSGATAQYGLSVTWSNGTTTTPAASSWSVADTTYGSVSASGLLSVPSTISGNGSVQVQASITIDDVTYNPTKSVSAVKVVPTSVTINGASSVLGGSTAQYSLAVAWNNSTNTTVAADSWSVAPGTFGTISASGLFSASSTVAGNVTVSANVTIDGTAFNPTKSVAVTIPATSPAPFWGVGPALPANWSTFVNGLTQAPALTGDGKYQVSFDAIGATSYMYFAYPSEHGEASFFDKLSQFFGGWGGAGNSGPGPSAASNAQYKDVPVTATVTINGSPIEFFIYRTDFANLGTAAQNQWEVTLATP